MKRLVAVLLCMTMAVSITACGNSETENNKVAGTEAGDKPESISVICSTDEEGLYEYAGKKYEEMYGVKVNLICQSYDSTHEKITTTWTGGGDADVCYVDIPWVAEFESKGVTIDLSEYMDEDVKNSLIESSLNQMIYNGKTEAIPFANGGKWMFYNKQMLEQLGVPKPTSWANLWDPKLSDEILMQNSIRDAFMIALKQKGYSLNTSNPEELAEARDMLIQQKPLVQAYVIDQVRDKMINGEAAEGVIYSGEMLYIQEQIEELGLDYDLEYVVPEEGTTLWIDCWVVPKNAENKEAAEKWINFLCRPDIAKKNFDYITYSTPNTGAYELSDEELQNNEALFPDMDSPAMKNSEILRYLGDDTDNIYNEMWKEVKAQ